MAEFLFNARSNGEFFAESAATSAEEIGNPVHPGTKRILNRLGIDCSGKRARRLKKSDYAEYDYVIAMDEQNVRDVLALFGGDPLGKVRLLASFAGKESDVADPWYTGDFEATYRDITEGLDGFFGGEVGR